MNCRYRSPGILQDKLSGSSRISGVDGVVVVSDVSKSHPGTYVCLKSLKICSATGVVRGDVAILLKISTFDGVTVVCELVSCDGNKWRQVLERDKDLVVVAALRKADRALEMRRSCGRCSLKPPDDVRDVVAEAPFVGPEVPEVNEVFIGVVVQCKLEVSSTYVWCNSRHVSEIVRTKKRSRLVPQGTTPRSILQGYLFFVPSTNFP